jgi:hypothetical protein
MYYDERYDYSLGQLIPTVVALVVAYAIAKAIAFFGLVTTKNYNKWAKFFAAITGIAYAIYMLPHIKVKNEILVLLAPFVFASFVGCISWVFYWLAFASVAKDDKEDSVDKN